MTVTDLNDMGLVLPRRGVLEHTVKEVKQAMHCPITGMCSMPSMQVDARRHFGFASPIIAASFGGPVARFPADHSADMRVLHQVRRWSTPHPALQYCIELHSTALLTERTLLAGLGALPLRLGVGQEPAPRDGRSSAKLVWRQH